MTPSDSVRLRPTRSGRIPGESVPNPVGGRATGYLSSQGSFVRPNEIGTDSGRGEPTGHVATVADSGVKPSKGRPVQGAPGEDRCMGRAGAYAIATPPVFVIWPKEIHNRVNEMHCKLRRVEMVLNSKNAAKRAARGLPEPPTCAGHKKDGTPCKKSPIRGATVCRVHGGAAPQVLIEAAQKLALASQVCLLPNIELTDDVLAVTDGVLSARRIAGGMLNVKPFMPDHQGNRRSKRC